MQFDSKSVSLAVAALAAAVALPLFANAGPAPAPQFTAEKCYGIAAASVLSIAGRHVCDHPVSPAPAPEIEPVC